MADWNVPVLTTHYATCMDDFKNRDLDAVRLAESPVNTPTGYIRYNRAINIFEEWSGSAWVAKVIAIAGGGTGATTPSGIISGLGLGTMAFQNSNTVAITGGSITCSPFMSNAVTITGGNITVSSVRTTTLVANSIHSTAGYSAGPEGAPITVINGSGNISESRILDEAILTRVAANEYITGSWTFPILGISAPTYPIIQFNSTGATVDHKIWRIYASHSTFTVDLTNDAGSLASPAFVISRSGHIATSLSVYCNIIVIGLVDASTKVFTGDGSGASPSFAFRNEQNTGFSRYIAGHISVTTLGVTCWHFTSGGDLYAAHSGVRLITGAGTFVRPSITFTADLNTGLTYWNERIYFISNTINAMYFGRNGDSGLFEVHHKGGAGIQLDADNGRLVIAPQSYVGGKGGYLAIGRNPANQGASGSLVVQSRFGVYYYLWVDLNGKLRIHTVAPSTDGTSDTFGTIVGTQT